MLLDLVNRMLSKVLTDFSDDPTLHVGVEGVPQIRQCARWCDDDERLHLALAHKLFHRRGYALGEAVLLEVMPVGRFHSASDGRTCALEYAAWAVGTLLAVGGFSSTKTRSVFRLGNFSSPSLRRNSALRPSPTNTNGMDPARFGETLIPAKPE